MYKQGVYIPANVAKYKGDHRNIFYRSSWEQKFMKYCDTHPHILEWGSEEIWIPYKNPLTRRASKYYPDFYIKVRDKDGRLKKYIIDIKPVKQTKPPIKSKKANKQYLYEANTYAKNQAKWDAARKYCKKRQAEFLVFTEKELGLRF